MPRTDQRLTRDFMLHEFLVSETYPKIATELKPSTHQVACLRLLSEAILQPTRDRWGVLRIGSGFRNDQLNTLVGGKETSDHLLGAAADFNRTKGLMRVYLWIRWSHLPYRQLIWYRNRHFIHVSVNTPGKFFKHECWIES